jgi:hypothetical protein
MTTRPARVIGCALPEEAILCLYGISHREMFRQPDKTMEPELPGRRKRSKTTTNRRLR